MKTTILNTNDFIFYGFEKKPLFMNLKTYKNGYKEVSAVFTSFSNKTYIITNEIKTK